jgi:hypothetical protein
MNCGKVKEHLSEYIDESLEAATKALVEEHLSACKDCQQEVASLRMLINDLGSMETVVPPKDFLDQLHKRMERRSWFSKILYTLSIPMRAKLPMKFAGAVVVVVLAFTIFLIQKEQYGTKMTPLMQEPIQSESSPRKMAKAPLETGVQEEANSTGVVREKAKPKPQVVPVFAQRDEAKHLEDSGVKKIAPVETRADHTSRKGTPIELSLVIERVQPTDSLRVTSDMEASQARETKVKRTLTAVQAVPTPHVERDRGIEQLLPRLTEIVERAGGKVVSVEYAGETHTPEFVHVEVPAKQISIFQNDLQALGELHGLTIGPTGEDEEVFPIRIRLLTP